MILGAVAGVCIVCYSPFPLLVNLAFAFIFAAKSTSRYFVQLGTADFCLYVTCVTGDGKVGFIR